MAGEVIEQQRADPRRRLDRALLLGHFDEGSVLANSPTKRDDAAKVALPLSLIGLHVTDAFANAVALGFQKRFPSPS